MFLAMLFGSQDPNAQVYDDWLETEPTEGDTQQQLQRHPRLEITNADVTADTWSPLEINLHRCMVFRR